MVLVCQSHATRLDALRHSVRAVRQGGIRLVGLVLNREKQRHGTAFGGRYYRSVPPQGESQAALAAQQEVIGLR